MRITVCELPHEPSALAIAWSGLCAHAASERSALVLLPELVFVEAFWESPSFDSARWSEATALTDAWLNRLPELGVDHVLGTRLTTHAGARFNEGFHWSRGGKIQALRRKYFMPDETAGWEAKWFAPGDPGFPEYAAGELGFGINICTELWALDTYGAYAATNVAAVMCPRATSARTAAKWRAAGIVAAVRAGAYCVSSNRAGPGESGGGAGWIIGPDGDVLAQTSPDSPFFTRDIDLEAAAKAKLTYPRYALARRPS